MKAPTSPVAQSRIIPGHGSESLRVRLCSRQGRPVLRVDTLEPLTLHTPGQLVVKGKPITIPLSAFAPFVEALDACRREAGYERPPVGAAAVEEEGF